MVGIKHKKTNTVPPWTQADLDSQIAAGNVPAGTTLSGFVLSTDWNDDHSSGAALNGQVLTADGAGGMSFTTLAAGGNVIGPVSAVDGNVVVFDGTTGKKIKDSGQSLSNYLLSSTAATTYAPKNGNISAFVNDSGYITSAALTGYVPYTGATSTVDLNTQSLLSGSNNITATNANALTVGRAGTTTPALTVDTSTASSITGVKITSAISGGGVTLLATGSANEGITLRSAGSGTAIINGGGTAAITVSSTTTNYATLFHIFNGANNSGGGSRFTVTAATQSGIVANTEMSWSVFNHAASIGHAAGTVTTQRDMRVMGMLHNAAAATVLTNVSNFSVTPGTIGNNISCTNYMVGQTESASVVTGTGTVTNAYGWMFNAPSGATNNYAAGFTGNALFSTLAGTGNRIVGTNALGVVQVATAGTDYQAPITLTTSGSSGAATFTGNVLNIPQYSGGSAAYYTWSAVTLTAQAGAVNNAYITNNAGLVTVTLPAVAAIGDKLIVQGQGAGGWKIAQNALQVIHFESLDTTAGVTGSLASTQRYDSVELICITANTDWVVRSSMGNITVV